VTRDGGGEMAWEKKTCKGRRSGQRRDTQPRRGVFIVCEKTGWAGHLEDLDFAVPTFLSRRRRGSACFGDVKAKNEVGG